MSALHLLLLLYVASCPVGFLFAGIDAAASGSGCCGDCTAGLVCESAAGVTLAGSVVVVTALLELWELLVDDD